MILLIDNYDSFSYNLYQMLGAIEPDIWVIRNDTMSAAEIGALKPAGVVLSPGPGRPENSGVCIDVINAMGSSIPLLGVCLGHQAICMAYGATISYAKQLMHGKQSTAAVDTACPLFAGCPEYIDVARYHSLAVLEETLPPELAVTARTNDGEVMAVMHRQYPIFGVQFHPESILTPNGKTILNNYIQITKEYQHHD
jgi:anthranilate synthase component 2